MKIQHGEGETEFGPGVSIELTGDEVATAIDSYLLGQGVRVKGSRTVYVGALKVVYVDPSGSMKTQDKMYIGSGETLYPFEVVGRTFWIPEVPHNSCVTYNDLIFHQSDATEEHCELRSVLPEDMKAVMYA